MLTGQVLYYSTKTGSRLAAMDSDVTAEYAQRAAGKDVAVWACTNGDPRDVRYFHAGKQISAAHALVAKIGGAS